MLVMKFGGSSVADRTQLEKVFEIVKGLVDKKPVVISSAHKGMTDKLISAAKSAVKGDFSMPDVIDYQSEISASLGCPPDLLSNLFTEISDLLRGISLVKELSPRSLDYIASFGERMAVRSIADFFTRKGLKCQAFDVWDLGFITDSKFGDARPLPGFEKQVQKAFQEKVPADVVPIVTGFIGQNENGEITTVGRNGSDLTATLLGSALGAEEVEIWTDTDGVMSADPSVVPDAKNIPSMTFDEAAELAYFGSRVLHPSTLEPAMNAEIPVRVLNTNHPSHPGTVIGRQSMDGLNRVTSIAYKEGQTVFTLTTTRMLRRAGFLAQVFEVLGRYAVVVDMISTSEISVSFTTQSREALEKALPELKQYGECDMEHGKTMLVVVGNKLAKRRGQGSEILGALAQAGARVEMISFGMGSINFSMVVDDSAVDKAVPVLHKELFS